MPQSLSDRSLNVVILMADQHRAWSSGCYGDPKGPQVHTPHIDRLAAEGTLFEHAFCASPLCGPSRTSFLTGTHPHTHGLVTHPNGRHRSGNRYRPQLQPGIRSLIAQMRDRGYQTHGVGYNGISLFDGEKLLSRDPDFLGFTSMGVQTHEYAALVGKDVARQYNLAGIQGEMWEPSYFNVEGRPFPHDEEQMFDSLVAADARRFLERRDPDQPFLLYVGFRAPHPPWCAPKRFHEMYDPAQVDPLPDYQSSPPRDKPRRVIERHHYFDIPHYSEQMVRNSIAAYHGFVSYMDDCVGRVLDELDTLSLRDNTLVIYAADHGENLYRHGLCEKHTLYEDAIRIPLIFSLPGRVPQGQRTEALASIMDIMPTVLALTGMDIPAFVEGCDLRPAFNGQDVRQYVMTEYYHSLDPCRMVRDHRYKYIHTEEDICELYDLRNDPEERLNLAWYPQYRERVERMDAIALADWEIPDLPVWAAWNDLNEKKQRQRLAGLDIVDVRPEPPAWVRQGPPDEHVPAATPADPSPARRTNT